MQWILCFFRFELIFTLIVTYIIMSQKIHLLLVRENLTFFHHLSVCFIQTTVSTTFFSIYSWLVQLVIWKYFASHSALQIIGLLLSEQSIYLSLFVFIIWVFPIAYLLFGCFLLQTSFVLLHLAKQESFFLKKQSKICIQNIIKLQWII